MIRTLFSLILIATYSISYAQEYILFPELQQQYSTTSSLKTTKKRSTSQTEYSLLQLPFFDDFANNTVYPNQKKWTDKNVYINNSFAPNSPSIGIATFDALNNKGLLYENATTTTFDADTLTSRALNLAQYRIQYPSNKLYTKSTTGTYSYISETCFFTDLYSKTVVSAMDGYLYSSGIQLYSDNALMQPINDSIFFSNDKITYTYIKGSYTKTDSLYNYTVADSIVLSFYYLSGGYGDMPEDDDSLIVEYYAPSNRSGIFINEVTNSWIEIYNATDTTVNIANLYLIDDTLQNIIDSNSFDNYKINQNINIDPYSFGIVALNSSFKLNTKSNILILLSQSKNEIDSFYCANSFQNAYYARTTDGAGTISEILTTTKGTLNGSWKHFPNCSLTKNTSFSLAAIPLDKIEYLTKGFRFRFRNKASLSNDLSHGRSEDHWHIDMVWIDTNRTVLRPIPQDAFFVKSYLSNTYLDNQLRAIPYSHMTSDIQFKESVTIDIANYDTLNPRKLLLKTIAQKNYTATNKQKFASLEEAEPNPNTTSTTQTFSISPLELKNFLLEDTATRSDASFDIKFYYTDKNKDEQLYNDFKWNDTITVKHTFDNYYAYDDGTAEAGYGFRGEKNAKIAYQYSLLKEDTLKAIAMYFNQTLYDLEQTKIFTLCIWKANGDTPGELLYEQPSVENIFGNNNGFLEFTIDPQYIVNTDIEQLIVSGNIFIGWQQPYDIELSVGLDLNTNSVTKLFVNYNSQWEESSLKTGSLMLRPIFYRLTPSTNIKESKKTVEFEMYPIPAQDILTVTSDNAISQITLFDMVGTIILQSNETSINVSNIAAGIYFVQVIDSNKNSGTKKLLINK